MHLVFVLLLLPRICGLDGSWVALCLLLKFGISMVFPFSWQLGGTLPPTEIPYINGIPFSSTLGATLGNCIKAVVLLGIGASMLA